MKHNCHGKRGRSRFFPQQQGQYLASVALSFDYSELAALSESGHINLEVIILARNEEKRVIAGVRDQVDIKPGKEKESPRFLYQNLLHG